MRLKLKKKKKEKEIFYKNDVGITYCHLYDDTRFNPKSIEDIPEEVKLEMVLRSGSMAGSGERLVNALGTKDKAIVTETLKNNFGLSGFGGIPDESSFDEDYRISGYDFMHKKASVEWLVNNVGYFKAFFTHSQFAEWCFKYEEELRKKMGIPKKKIGKLKIKAKKRRRIPKSSSDSEVSPHLSIIDEENEFGYTGEWWNVCEGKKEVNFPLNPIKRKMDVIDNEVDLKLLCDKMMEIPAFAYDTETNTLDVCADNEKFRCSDITISWGENNNYDIVVGKMRDEDINRNIDMDILLRYLKPVFEREDVIIVGANLKFDLHVMKRLGVQVRTRKLFDTELAAWLCDENSFINLKYNSGRYMKVAQTKFKETTESIPKEVKKQYGYAVNAKVNNFCLVSIEDGKEYCTDDSFYTWCLYLGFRELLEAEEMEKIYYNRMIPFMLVLFDMEERGVAVDRGHLERMQRDMSEDLERLQYEIYEIAGVEFNIGSSQQLCEILYGTVKPDKPILKDKVSKALQKVLDDFKEGKFDKDTLVEKLDKQGIYIDECGKMWRRQNVNNHLVDVNFGFPVLAETKGGSPSVDKHTLRRLAQQDYKNRRKREGVKMCRKILEYSKLEKLKGTFADGILEKIDLYADHRCHPNFRQVGCVKGDTLIPTSKGLIPINEISDSWIDGRRIEKKVSVVNLNGEWETTSHVVQFKNEGTKIIKTSLGIQFECSPIHPLWCSHFTSDMWVNNINGCRSRRLIDDINYQGWLKAEDIKEGNYIKVPIGYNSFSQSDYRFSVPNYNLPELMSKELAEFLGMYYADGSLHDSNGSFSVRITNGDTQVQDRVSYLSKLLFGVTAKIYDEPKKNSATTYITAKRIAEMESLYEMKRGCVNKVFPRCVLRSTKKCIKAFIKGLTLDCCVICEKNKRYIKFTFSNRISAEYLQAILFNLGIISSVRQDISKTDNVYHVSIYNENAEMFRKEIGFIEKQKDISFEREVKYKSHNYIVGDNCIWVKVSEVINGHTDVYDFSVPNTHSFVSGAFISHNTDSGRISCASPNLQQLPNADENDKYQIRSVFIGSEYYVTLSSGNIYNSYEEMKENEDPIILKDYGYTKKQKKILAIDYHNLEMVCLTYFSHDKNLSEMFANDDDAHGSTAVNMFGLDCTPTECKKKYPHLRQAAKTINFIDQKAVA